MTRPTPDGTECARAWEAMPWVLQESADASQKAWFAEHLAGCADCRREFELQERLHLAMSLDPIVEPDPEVGLRRLLARIDADDPQRAPVRKVANGSWVVRLLAAAVLVQAVGIGVLGMKLWTNDHSPASYRTLSSPSAPAPAGALHVVPEKSMSVDRWNTLLRDQHLSVVGGPNSVGAYTVVSDDAQASQADVIKRLHGAGIRFAEPATGSP
ncbi:zf-HC2 domain-containing protein [Luteibacter aegosomatis]|uniref:zf-HC2 domain-containing protein n=1 Tax=Luteibacter aegosomatis TaxID=2911537 RepID=UPI001FFC0CBF|nr:zf-HC2 domain-containing protein [Luteibacter aegosomatis]UPG85164.1 zf-HC2 domain-containing protein [Luteibacter aegosomatis]